MRGRWDFINPEITASLILALWLLLVIWGKLHRPATAWQSVWNLHVLNNFSPSFKWVFFVDIKNLETTAVETALLKHEQRWNKRILDYLKYRQLWSCSHRLTVVLGCLYAQMSAFMSMNILRLVEWNSDFGHESLFHLLKYRWIIWSYQVAVLKQM